MLDRSRRRLQLYDGVHIPTYSRSMANDTPCLQSLACQMAYTLSSADSWMAAGVDESHRTPIDH